MNTVTEIREAIDKLSLEERVALMIELRGEQEEDDDWDRQMKADAAAGKFDEMHARTLEDLKAGRCTPLEEGL